MSNGSEYMPSDAAIAAYPEFPEDNAHTAWGNNLARVAFDRGMKAGRDAALTEAADRLDAAEFEDYDTDLSDDGTGGYEYKAYAEGQGAARIFTSSAADFVRAIRSLQEGDK